MQSLKIHKEHIPDKGQVDLSNTKLNCVKNLINFHKRVLQKVKEAKLVSDTLNLIGI